MKRLFYKRGVLNSKRGQATTEIAIMGILILIALGTLIRYGQMMSTQQEIKMYTHRRALELAKMRRDTGRYGQVTLVAMEEVFPVNIFSSEREPTWVSASSSVSMHEGTGYYTNDGEQDRTQAEHVGATYYQIGTKMINNNTVIVMPNMKVRRRIDENDAPRTAWDADAKWLRNIVRWGADPDPTDYESLEPAPVVDTDQFIRTAYASEYQKTEDTADSSYHGNDNLNVQQTTTYEFIDENTLRFWDTNIDDVISMPGDVVIQTNKTIEQEREWTTPK